MVSSEWLRLKREELNLSQDSLAVQLQAEGFDVSRAAISSWEQGRAPSPIDDIRKVRILAKVLHVDIVVLLEIADVEIENAHQSESARRAALIVDRMSPAGQKTAIDLLRVLERDLE
jgi:transcriptional regulator with XRE-family HTH domain